MRSSRSEVAPATGEQVFSKVRPGLSSFSAALGVEELVDGDDAELCRDEFGYFAPGWAPSFVEADGELGGNRSALSLR